MVVVQVKPKEAGKYEEPDNIYSPNTLSPHAQWNRANVKLKAVNVLSKKEENYVSNDSKFALKKGRSVVDVFDQEDESEANLNDIHEHNLVMRPYGTARRTVDFFCIVCLIYTAIFTPFEIAFIDEKVVSITPAFVLNRIVDFVFFVEIVCTFFTAYFDDKRGEYVFSLRKIALNYIMTWFFLDIISTFPFDLLSSQTESGEFKILTLLRLTRLFKMLRILRLSRIVRRWESRLGIRYGVLHLAKFCCIVAIFAHWNACFWYLVSSSVAQYSGDFDWSETWMAKQGWEPTTALHVRYLGSLYWAVMTLTTIGYGDIFPQNTPERIASIFFQIIDASLFAYIVGSVTHLVQSLDSATNEFQLKMDQLNEYMKNHKLPSELQLRVREYFTKSQKHSSAYDASLLQWLSPVLRGEVVAWGYKDMIEKVPYFEGADIQFVTSVALNLRPETYAPNEFIFKEHSIPHKLYLMRRGRCCMMAGGTFLRYLGDGACFGEEVMTAKENRSTVQAVGHCCICSIEKDQLESVLRDHPAVADRIRKLAAKRLWQKIQAHLLAKGSLGKKLKSMRAREVNAAMKASQKPTTTTTNKKLLDIGTHSTTISDPPKTSSLKRGSANRLHVRVAVTPPATVTEQHISMADIIAAQETVSSFDDRLTKVEKCLTELQAVSARIERNLLSLR